MIYRPVRERDPGSILAIADRALRNTGYDDDVAFARHLTLDVGVAAIPSSVFWKDRRSGRHLVRFCFCKKDETLDAAIAKLKKWRA